MLFKGGITQAKIAHERSNGQGRIHMNVLWEMGAVEPILHGVLSAVKGFNSWGNLWRRHAFRLAEICVHYGVYYYPIVSSARAFHILWRKRAYHRFSEALGVVYEDPWLGGIMDCQTVKIHLSLSFLFKGFSSAPDNARMWSRRSSYFMAGVFGH